MIERRLPGLLRHDRSAAVADAIRLHHRRFHRARNIDHIPERGVHEICAGHHIVDRVVVTGDRRKLRVQADGNTTINAQPGIRRRLMAGTKLTLQVVKLRPHLRQLLHNERRLRPDR